MGFSFTGIVNGVTTTIESDLGVIYSYTNTYGYYLIDEDGGHEFIESLGLNISISPVHGSISRNSLS